MKQIVKNSFSAELLKWNRYENKRTMPWKGEKDPYKIWLSEIILQQTRVEQGLKYYERFLEAFPTIHSLATAPEKKVFKLWEGLGYYTRCRNLIAAAKFISVEKKGQFPNTYEEIKALKGVGPYTAAAIASFAFNLPYAVVDGNVQRVIARILGIHTPVDTTQGKKLFASLAGDLLDKRKPGVYNQAIMDFGATVCKPMAPLCHDCFFKKSCYAFSKNQVKTLPVKEKETIVKKRWLYYLVLTYQDNLLIRQRTQKDIWQGLYEFLPVETDREENTTSVITRAVEQYQLSANNMKVISVSAKITQQLSHQLITGRFIKLTLAQKPRLGKEWRWIPAHKLEQYPFPVFINLYLKSPNV